MYIYDVVVFYLDGNRWVPKDGKRFAVQVTFIGYIARARYIVDQLLKNPVPWLISIFALGFIIGVLIHRRSILSKLILIPIACLLLLESFTWYFQPIFYSSIYPEETTILWHGLTEKISSWIGINYYCGRKYIIFAEPNFIILTVSYGLRHTFMVPYSLQREN
jgi:hypothetical protein